MKRSRKALSILLSLAMLVAMMLPMAAPASAVATYTVSNVPYLVAGTASQTPGTMLINLDSASMAIASTSIVYIDLPSSPNGYYATNMSVSIPQSANGTTNSLYGQSGAITSGPVTTSAEGSGYREWYIQLTPNSNTMNGNPGALQVSFGSTVYVPGGVTGDVSVAFSVPDNSAFTKGSAVIGTVGNGTTAVSVESVEDFGSGGGNIGTIDIQESAPNSLETATDSVKLTLPPGFTWNTSNVSEQELWGDVTYNGVTGTDNAGRDLKVNLKAGTTKASMIKLSNLAINVDESVAKQGDVTVSIGGSSSFSTSDFVIGHYGNYGFTTSAATTTTLTAGQDGQKMGELEVDEGLAGSYLNGRTITLTLPTNVKWQSDTPDSNGNVTMSSYGSIDNNLSTTNGISISWAPVGTDGTMIKGTLNVPSGEANSSTPAKLVFKDLEVTPAVDYSGDIPVTIGGTCGVTGTVTLATVKAPVTVSGSTPDMQLGLANQATGDVTVTENIAGALQANPDQTYMATSSGTTYSNGTTTGYLTLNLPIGVTFTNTPTVAVTNGDLQLIDGSAATSTAADGHGVCTFQVKSSSTTPSTIKVSNMELTVDRTVPQGQVYLKVKGSAVDETGSTNATNPTFPNDTTAAKCYVANVVTPSEAASVVFTIGSTVYTVNGAAQVMDAAPYIDQNGRSFVPVRYLANVLGVANSNITFDGSNVTLTKGSTKVQLTIGSNQITVNGTAQTMDTAPVINNGRTMLPARFVAEAFGAQVGFANNQVVVNLNPTGSSATTSTTTTTN